MEMLHGIWRRTLFLFLRASSVPLVWWAKRTGLRGKALENDPLGGALIGIAQIGMAPYHAETRKTMARNRHEIQWLKENLGIG